jgi:crotonobetainyl-CoA:carnitine CoA-transferase CaiB-like acyl-CoA transferase
MKDLLARFRVIDASHEIAGRYCARLFSLLGAHVIRTVASDDSCIGYGGQAGIDFGNWLDEGKTHSAGDENMPSPEMLVITHPGGAVPEGALRLETDWFAAIGPYRNWKANDPVIQALVGLAHGFGPIEGPPILAQGHAPQLVAGTIAFIAALSALLGRERGALIDTVDVSIFEAACCFSEPNAVSYAHFGHSGTRLGINRYAPTYPCSIYPARGGWLGVTCLTPQQWQALTALIGRPELAEDPRFATTLDRLAHADAVDAILQPAFADRDATETAELGQSMRIPMAVVSDLSDLSETPHWKARGSFDAQDLPGIPFHIDHDGAQSPLAPISKDALPLSGLRVVDFTMGWAGPLCTRMLSDLGADVIKIESFNHPDWWRGWEKPEPGPAIEAAPVFSVVNRGKRGICLDLKTRDGLAYAELLIKDADIIVENFAPGVLARLGLGPERLHALRPGLISLSMGAFGSKGPWSGFRAYGSTVEQASGIPTINGCDGMPPALQHIAYGDPVAGLYATMAVLTGLAGRAQYGGSMIDLAQVETLFQLAADAIIARKSTAKPLARSGSRRNIMVPSGCFAARGDDEWVAIACHDDESWHALCRVLGRDAWRRDPSLANAQGRKSQLVAIEQAIADWVHRRPTRDAVATLQAAGVPCAPVQPIQQIVRDPQLAESGYWVTLERAHLGRHVSGAAPFRFNKVRPCATRAAPLMGEHQREVTESSSFLRNTS